MGGTAGTKYTININVRGVVGTRCYTGGTAATTAAGVGTGPNNTWYAGGSSPATASGTRWRFASRRSQPRQTGQTNASYDIYFINSFNTSAWCQKEATYETRFNASFPVTGGATITLVNHDSNCRTLANCGSVEAQTSCNSSAARMIDMSGVRRRRRTPARYVHPATHGLTRRQHLLSAMGLVRRHFGDEPLIRRPTLSEKRSGGRSP